MRNDTNMRLRCLCTEVRLVSPATPVNHSASATSSHLTSINRSFVNFTSDLPAVITETQRNLNLAATHVRAG